MGNFMETCVQRNPTEVEEHAHTYTQSEENQKQGKQESYEKTSPTFSKEGSTVRVKLVLTKDELQWLLHQLKKNEGRKLEEVLGEIEKSRKTGESVTKWKPRLESIMESPETHHNMDRSSS
ncbi:hypothetical protein LXL04_026345 [Taraxacum kok-saghyz]